MTENKEWVYKYEPKTLEDLIIDEENLKLFKNYLDKETFLNCTLYGKQGIGKTSVAKIVINTIPDCTHLFINASAENSVDTVRHKVHHFTQFVGYSQTKIVVLDEVNRMSKAAQDSLRTLIEECISDTRFILTTNYINELIEPLQSRCIPINLSPPKKEIFKRLIYILKNEGIKYTKDDGNIIMKDIIAPHYPDIRSMIKHLEISSITGEFKLANYDNKSKLDSLIADIKKKMNNINTCRQLWLDRQTDFDNDYEMLASRMYNSYSDDPEKMHIIAQYLREMPLVLDKEIQFCDMVYSLNETS
jgi:DNA polymerase III delta prime subunit